MALGEFYKGAGRGVQNLVYMHVGTGIGAGIVLDGQLYRGFSDAAGEIGYMIVGDPAQGAGREFGTFEGNYSTAAVRERMMAHPELQALCRDLAPGESVIQRLADEARTSTEAGRLFEDICLHWAYGIANLVCVLNPELVILGGDLVHIGDHGLSYIRDRLARLVPIVPDVRLAQLGSRAGVVGAFFYVLESDPSLTGKLGAFERGEETP
ncbi:MAG: ROK family protein, partial [Alicyclobacillaceae bacterium]|nr:ROK family protein [Alicyclobacillaceae bacterium]